ncbi:MAG: hypothetical protein ACMXX6_00215 [Candidatus Woesearchaeota archaeon]
MSLTLEKFYEKDIVEFLEHKAKEKNIESDSVAIRVQKLLERKEEERAEEEIRKAVEEYNTLSLDNIYKEINLKKIRVAMKHIDNYLKTQPFAGDDIKQLVRSYKELSNEQDIIPPKLEFLEEKDKITDEKERQEAQKDYQQKAKLDKIIRNINEEMFVSIRKKDFKESLKNYMLLKKSFEEYPERFIEDKKNIYNDLLALYVQIQKLKNIEKEKKTETKKEEKPQINIDPKEFYQKIEDAKSKTRNKEFEKATQIILDLKHQTNKLTNEQKHLREMLNNKLDVIIQRIELAKKL